MKQTTDFHTNLTSTVRARVLASHWVAVTLLHRMAGVAALCMSSTRCCGSVDTAGRGKPCPGGLSVERQRSLTFGCGEHSPSSQTRPAHQARRTNSDQRTFSTESRPGTTTATVSSPPLALKPPGCRSLCAPRHSWCDGGIKGHHIDM